MTRFPHTLLGFALCAALAAAADPADPVAAKLAKAKDAYGAEWAKFQKAVLESFDVRESAARQAGDKKLVDRIKADRDALVANGTIPATIPAILKQRQAAMRFPLESAYKAAIKEYTRTKKDDAAIATEKELKRFQLTGNFYLAHWAEDFAPGTYQVTYGGGASSATTIREDGTYRRARGDGAPEPPGKIEAKDGKLILRHDSHVEVWAKDGAAVRVRHWHPAASYPDGQPETGTAVLKEKK